ncbi:MAG: hypothetical protein J6M53_04625 [Bacteroidaceae bacterium]|nr:hypothetical protein [Bacteroidaceae bacterium]
MYPLLEFLLSYYNVPHTTRYTREVCDTHPYRDNLLGISQVLEEYGLTPVAIRVRDKHDIGKLPTPFLAEVSGRVRIVTEVSRSCVSIDKDGKTWNVTPTRFQDLWSGAVLFAKPSDKAIEPEYDQHITQQRVRIAEAAGILISTCAFILAVILPRLQVYSIPLIADLVINGLAAALCFLLFKLSIGDSSSSLIRKFCLLNRKQNCGRLAKEHHAVLPANYNLSEIGLAFFLGNTTYMLLCPAAAMAIIPFVFILALPLTVWSVWYQSIRASQWCLLCLSVMVLVWVQTLFCLWAGVYTENTITELLREAYQYIPLLCLYTLLGIAFHRVALYHRERDEAKTWLSSLMGIKRQAAVFRCLLEKEKMFPSLNEVNTLRYGGTPQSARPTITVVSNLFCHHCAGMHRRLQRLLEAGFPIEYVLMTFGEASKEAAAFIIADYIENGAEKSWQRLTRWYGSAEERRKLRAAWTVTGGLRREADMVIASTGKWASEAGIIGTPVVLVDGRPMPKHYDVEDLIGLFHALPVN